jgi:hypothetical protein
MDPNTKFHHERLDRVVKQAEENKPKAASYSLEPKAHPHCVGIPISVESDFNGGKKNDAGKPPLSLLPIEALEEIAQVLSYGATKYGKNNYKAGFNRSRLLDATLRHVYADASKQDLDPESNLMHLAHAAASLIMLIQNIKTGVSKDDR